ncbi:MAG: prepilin peptidase, partial [Desulfuromonadales bacterium]|nr:prepilin peptidase [Desulfuromonadales bacterium]
MPTSILYPWIFFLGACIGSFLNVCIYRIPARLSIVSPPSRCPKCETKIRWWQNIPIVSWLFLRGKCVTCKEKI